MNRGVLITGALAVVGAGLALALWTGDPAPPVIPDDDARYLAKRLLAAAHPDAQLGGVRLTPAGRGPTGEPTFRLALAYRVGDDAPAELRVGLAVLSTHPCRVKLALLGDSGPEPPRAPTEKDTEGAAMWKPLCAALD